MFIKKIINFISFLFVFISTKTIQAQSLIDPNDSQKKYVSGNYNLNDFVSVFVNASVIILGLVGSLALLFFVYGGLMLLLSAGNTEKVTKAKGILKAAVIGLIIVFTSYIIIRFALMAMGIEWEGGMVAP